MKKVLTTLSLAVICHLIFAQANPNPWLDTPESRFATQDDVRQIIPKKYRSLTLDLEQLKAALDEAPMRFSPEAEAYQATLTIPMPDGSMQAFQVVEAPVMHPDLAARYPYMRSFAGWSKTDGTAYLRCGYTQKGFHAMILSAGHSTVYIDRFREGDDRHYISYFKKDYRNPHQFECLVEEAKANPEVSGQVPQSEIGNSKSLVVGDCQHRNYALALACTGEYATFHGGTKPLVLAEFNVAIGRINGIYEREMAVTLTMVANTDLLIYLNAGSDPYTNNDGGTMLGQNQTTCDNIIGNANYDIGHVFSTGGGGVASLRSVCNPNAKARGVTGLGSPIGDPFYVDYVAHEMGHQFGGNHTQNNDCNRVNATSMEPGSGSTIMAYAGICAPDVQNNSDDYFHAINLDEIHSHLLGTGNNCATTTNSGNNAPIVALPVSSYNIPKSTPFVLTAQGIDANTTDVLTYCWEQMDNQVATMPPVSTSTGGPAFRSLDPTTSPSRYFPNLSAIIAGTTPTWEVLPSVARTMTFRCTLRDNHPGAGCSDEADLVLNVNGSAGPFVVTNPNTSAITWTGGNMATVTWNVAGTNMPPIATSQVEILLSADGGNTYPYTLLATTNNDGTESVLIPNIATTQARVMIKAKNNVYFDISNQNFRIELAVVPSFLISATADTAAACQSGQATYTYNMSQLAGFNQAVNFTANGLPAGATANFTPNNIAPPATVVLTVGNLSGIAPGTYPFTVTAMGGTITNTDNLVLIVLGQVNAAPTLSAPADGAQVTNAQPTLTWVAVPQAASYLVEVSTSPNFSTLVAAATVTTTSYAITAPLNLLEVYYWRVKAINPCSESGFTAFNAFHFIGNGCQVFDATGLPLTIPNTAGTVTKTLNVTFNQPIVSVKTSMNIDHSYIGDLDVRLVSPQNTTRVVFDRPGVPASNFGCEGDDINASFSDSHTNTAAQFESTCGSSSPAISGNYRPMEAFSAFAGQNAQGNWTLSIRDNFDDDGGGLLAWSIEVCGLTIAPPAVLLQNNMLTVTQNQSGVISNTYLQGQGTPATDLVFTLLATPANGQLLLNGVVLAVGGTFTQADIDAGLLTYQHDGSMTTTDEFEFDFQDNSNHWLHAQFFQISIIQNNLAANAALTQPISCTGANNGQITVAANGGNAPLEYSLNGGAYQSSNVFGGLAPGTYSIFVKDATGFTISTNSVDITAPPVLNASANVSNDVITVTASGGTGSLQYSIGGAPQSSNVFNGVANGIYMVTVTDGNGCTATTTATVAVNTLVVSASLTNDVSCFGENDATITVVVSGGSPDFQYSLNGGAPQNSNLFPNLGPGSYTIQVTDADGFTQTTNAVTVSSPMPLTAMAIVNMDTITVVATGGTGSLQYSIGGAPQISNIFTHVANGTYTITVSDENICTATSAAIVAVNGLSITALITNGISCFGEDDATITATAFGGLLPYEYSLNGGAYQSSNVFPNLGPGSYTVEVFDAAGFSRTSDVLVITNPSQLAVTATATGNTITVMATGGTGFLQYSIGGSAPQNSNEFNNLPNGTYTLTVTDDNGCTATATATVFTNNIVVSAMVTGQLDCFNGTDGQITVTASGGMAPYEYSLNGGTFQNSNVFNNLAAGTYTANIQDADGLTQNSQTITLAAPPQITGTAIASGYTVTVTATGGTGSLQYSLDGGAFQSSNNFTSVASGSHTITVRDANGCEISLSVLVTVQALAVSGSVSQPIDCPGGSNGQIMAVGTGGVPGYQYSLNGGPLQNSNVFSNLAAGSYTLTIKDSGGFTSTAIVNLTAPPALVVAPSANNQTVTVTASGGTPPYQYRLDNGALQSSNTFNNVPNGSYTVTVVDANGCTKEASVFVGGLPPNIFVSLSQPVSCNGGSDGVITVNGSGGLPPYTYSLNGGAYQSSNMFTGLSAGTYTVSVKGSDGAVTTAPNIIIVDPPLLTVTATVMGSTITATGTGGTGNYEYSLDGSSFDDSNMLEATTNGSLTITIRDERGCTATTTVTVNAMIGVNLAIDEIGCEGVADGQIEVLGVTGGTPPYQYALNGGAFTAQNLFTNLAPGDYIISVKDATGDIFEAPSVALIAPDELTANFQLAFNNLTILANGGTGALSYSINGGSSFQSSNFFPNLPLGTYQVVVKDENGCTFTGEVIVDVSGTDEVSGSLVFEVTPNPSNGLFLVKLDLPRLTDLELAVYDVVGRQVFAAQTATVGASQLPLDLQGLVSGTYLLRVRSGEHWGVRKLVISW
jgi:subtilisin-like proprotein convertase family protein